MAESLYTIPINEAFEKALSEQSPVCPMCLLREMLEKNELERILGAAMMEPDVRTETNKLGFCKRHFEAMLSNGNRLGLALILESHIAETEKAVFGGGTLLDPHGEKEREKLTRLGSSCYICKRIDDAFTKMLCNTVYLYETDEDFRLKYSSQKTFCLPHYSALLGCGRANLSKKLFSKFFSDTREIEKKYISELKGDVSWFCKKFDYRYDSEPWYNSKDSVTRAVSFLSGGTGKNDK